MRLLLFIVVILWFIACTNNTNNEKSNDVKDTLGLVELSTKIRKNPLNAKLFSQRAELYWKIQKKDSAINDAIIALRLDSLNENYALQLAEYYFNTIQIKEALATLEKYINRNPESLKVLTRLGKFYSLLKDYANAKKYIDKALIINSQYADAHFVKGMVLVETNQPTEAIKAFKEVVQYDPENTEAYMMLGLLYQEFNDTLAIQYYQTVARLSPKDPQPYYNMGYFYQENKNYAKALEKYNYILRNIDSKYVNAYFNQGYIYLMYLNDYGKAMAYFDSVLMIEPNKVEAIYNKGLCYEKLHDYTSARSLYIKAKSIVPNYELAIKGLNRLDKY
jgi:tetratricopeptide (TPR) repeat protein